MDLPDKLDWLIDQWCERRALRPLQYMLPAYPTVMAHTDQFGDVLNASREVRKQCRKELTAEELTQLESAIAELADIMNRRMRG